MKLEIYSRTGEKIRTLVNGSSVNPPKEWDGRNESGASVAAGTYLVNMTIDGKLQTRKVVVIK
jgi:flagellar hook assembly protein FlgD